MCVPQVDCAHIVLVSLFRAPLSVEKVLQPGGQKVKMFQDADVFRRFC